MAKSINILTLCYGILAAILYTLDCLFDNGFIHIAFILTVVMTYHFAFRRITSEIVAFKFEEKFNYNWFWFKHYSWEDKVFDFLKVRAWKDKMPTAYPKKFSIKENSLEHIAKTMCISEFNHETNIIISFLSLFLVKLLGHFWLLFFIATLGALCDMIFIIMQRYNRPRLVRVIEKKKAKKKSE